jgi:hypothetical protein
VKWVINGLIAIVLIITVIALHHALIAEARKGQGARKEGRGASGETYAYYDTVYYTTPTSIEFGTGADLYSCGKLKVYTPSPDEGGAYELSIYPGGDYIPKVCGSPHAPHQLFAFPERRAGAVMFQSAENTQVFFMMVYMRYGKKSR